MNRLLGLAVAGLFFVTPAYADFTAKDASAATITFKNANTCTASVCIPQTAITDSTGTTFVGVTANGLKVDGSAVTQPISAVSLPLPTGAATNATLGSPFQAGGSIGNTGFNATQGGAANSATNPFFVGASEATVSAGNTLNAVVANTTGTSISVTGFGAALVNVNCSVNCTGGTTITIQGSDVVGFQSIGMMPVAGGSGMVSTVVNQSGAAFFCAPNMGYTSMRANVSAYSAGTISVTITPINASTCDVAQVANALASVLANNGTNGATNTPTSPVTEQNGTAYPNHGNWVANTGSGTAATAITVLAAPGANSLYVTGVQCGRDDTGTTAMRVTFNDTNASVLVLPNNGGGGGNNATFNPPLKVAATTAFTATPSTAITTIRCNAQAFIAP